ncbi:PREDICTED: farnesyl pyrophosphate synthase isoform X2 [Nicrophorus vespilloides]|uniref:Farnesyl pyrophosphate synthase n=1 Tax=Nicrophorus vespilloides TaxID=110193 RepID=A0ABM1LZQ7_NICVS|nr:PREDICTED: farnesyl pyrophosphate synthase isoform X2 [Nicrophorus vespilloides]
MSAFKTIGTRFFRQASRILTQNVKITATAPRAPLHHCVFHGESYDDVENRALSTLQTKIAPAEKGVSLVSKDESREFMAIFPDIVRDLTDAGRHTDIPEVNKWYTKVLQYNVPNGKKNRGLAVVAAYKMLEEPENLTPENVRLANILGWCVEILQAYLLMIDDVMDGSKMRRGAPCWYRNAGVGLNGINDALMLNEGIYVILRKHFAHLPYYRDCVELFHEVSMKTMMGQSLDMMTSNTSSPLNLDSFTMKRYNSIVKYKTAYYSFQLPVTLAMHMAGKNDPEIHRQAKTILLEMGHFFQVQDDFLDCYGDQNVIGKTNANDIYEGKCSWLVVVALQRATPEQRKILDENYGRPEPEAAQAVLKLFDQLGLPTTYAIYEEETNNLIRTHIQQISKGLPHNLFFKFMDKIYKRES